MQSRELQRGFAAFAGLATEVFVGATEVFVGAAGAVFATGFVATATGLFAGFVGASATALVTGFAFVDFAAGFALTGFGFVADGGSVGVTVATRAGSAGEQRGSSATASVTGGVVDATLATVAGRDDRNQPLASTPTMMPAANTTGVRARDCQNVARCGRSHSSARRNAGPSCAASH